MCPLCQSHQWPGIPTVPCAVSRISPLFLRKSIAFTRSGFQYQPSFTRMPSTAMNIVLSNEALPRWMAKPPFVMDEDETDPYSADYRFWTWMSRSHHPWVSDAPAARGRSPAPVGFGCEGMGGLHGCIAGGGRSVAEELGDCEYSYVPLLPRLQALQNA
ncbi:hypothetical protein B0H14DRAFT_2606261 [Mycena olivaceomarginata]|nr:hypothetical protein B0H14DRAFT_2606261 [Mycena olivaceomarginata]